jgi:FkbM family methyltransferase
MNLISVTSNILHLLPKYLHLPVEFQARRISQNLEREMYYLQSLINKSGRAIDIGANRGLYTYALSKLCTSVEAFEPQPWCSELIREYSKKFNKNINVYDCALSNSNSTLELNIPIVHGKIRTGLLTGLASFSKPEVEHKILSVSVNCLDEYNFQDVVFIKIDVEGHESKVIEGAEMTILRDHPIILIEIEQRHLGNIPIDVIFNQIISLGYNGFFLQSGQLTPINLFDVNLHQDLSQNQIPYINNFIFKPYD